ncbi:MAG: hypothetical protein AVDCRST_MAG34-3214 [uncultured Nocardioidaceae bacterium]|uniref:N-acetyltransferase domain-containing protein n=1 Tax=uncultured Nocardioidaceae bacterium TaxID=253824 RepID=A0A6J4MW73_9ACTN|nr:MAG: hypothetical protein AVDCRST_MAG34-3214 [uncultured Nocardioidaceae bacterium]
MTSRGGGSAALIGPEEPDDVRAIRALTLAAFPDQPAVAELVELIRASSDYVPGLALVARYDSEVVGHVMISHAALVDDRGVRRRVGVLSPLSVLPRRQRQGIGRLLVTSALRSAEAHGEPLVVLEGSPHYYPRLGFEPAAAHGITIELPDWAPPEAAMVHLLSGYRPEHRGRVEYPPAFDGI